MFAKLLQLLILSSGCEQGDDGGFEGGGDDCRNGIILYRICLFATNGSRQRGDDHRSIRSFTGGILHQQSRCSKLLWVFSSA